MYERSTLFIGIVVFGMQISTAAGTPVGTIGIHVPFDQIRCAESCEVPAILVAKKLSPGKKIKVSLKGNQKTMSRSKFHSKYPNGYKLYKNTERLAISFHANNSANLPGHCSLGHHIIQCSIGSWWCRVTWSDGELHGYCGYVPPAPDPNKITPKLKN